MDWIALYNHRRFTRRRGYLSPVQFEQRWLAAQQSAAATPGRCASTFGSNVTPDMPQLGRCPLYPKMRDNLLPDD